MFSKIFTELGLSDTTQRVFSDLIEKGPSTARQLAERLTMPRPSVYDHIKILIQKGLVVERNQENKKVFQVDDIKNIPDLIQRKIQTLQQEKKQIEELLPSLATQVGFLEPKIKFYSGAEGVKQVMNQVLWHRNIDTIALWPMSEMLSVLGKEFLWDHNKRRIKQNISMRVIWPKDKVLNFKDHPFLGTGGRHLRDLRAAPKGMSWNMGHWVYEDKVAFISSRKEAFGFVIHSKDLADLLRAQFEVIWNISKPMKPQPKYTDVFLKSIGEV